MQKNSIFHSILNELEKEKIVFLFGARYTNKKSIIQSIIKDLKKQDKKTICFSLDKEKNNPILKDGFSFATYVLKNFLKEDAVIYIFLEEIQNIKNAEEFLKSVFVALKHKVRMIVTSSISHKLCQKNKMLEGVVANFWLFSGGFREFLAYRGEVIEDSYINNLDLLEKCNKVYGEKLQKLFLEYLNFVGRDRDFCNLIARKQFYQRVKKDIFNFLRVEDIEGFRNLLFLLNSKIGSLVNKTELANILGLHFETIQKYLEVYGNVFFLDYVPPFYGVLKKELTKMPKTFFSSLSLWNGLLKAVDFFAYAQISPDLIRNYIYLALKNMYGQENIYYYQTLSKAKLDFVLLLVDKLVPVEVQFWSKVSKKFNPSLSFFNKNYQSSILTNVYYTQNYAAFDREKNLFFIPVYLAEFYDLRTSYS
jgi:uncharacterized protein